MAFLDIFFSKLNNKDVNWDMIKKGVLKYSEIMKELHNANLSGKNGEAFRKAYSNFYRMRRSSDFKEEYFKIFELLKKDNKSSFEAALNKIQSKTNRVEASFASKMIATINPDVPIWDSIVIENLGLKIPYSGARDREREICKIYKELSKSYKTFLKSPLAKDWLRTFETNCGKQKISDTKKLDFIIWQANRK